MEGITGPPVTGGDQPEWEPAKAEAFEQIVIGGIKSTPNTLSSKPDAQTAADIDIAYALQRAMTRLRGVK